MDTATDNRLIRIGRPALTCALLIGGYYLAPIEPGVSGTRAVVRAAATVALGLLVTWLILRQVRHQLANPQDAPLGGLITALVGGVVFFALADYLIAVSDPGQFVSLSTKTDALYFALATLTTVGYGDVYAAGQLARGLVVVQLVFNLAVIATAASVLTQQLGARVRRRQAGARPPRSGSPR
jgi:voltage-gated potassium channel Kch